MNKISIKIQLNSGAIQNGVPITVFLLAIVSIDL